MSLKHQAASLTLYGIAFYIFMHIGKWALSVPDAEELISPTPGVTCVVITRSSKSSTSCWKNPEPITHNPGTWLLNLTAPYEL